MKYYLLLKDTEYGHLNLDSEFDSPEDLDKYMEDNHYLLANGYRVISGKDIIVKREFVEQ